MLSIIIPVFNDAVALNHLAPDLRSLRDKGHQIIIVDGGSTDDSFLVANSIADLVITTEKGRAIQMNEGAKFAKSELLWFLHADSKIPEKADQSIISSCQNNVKACWGRFDINLYNSAFSFQIIAALMNLRSRMTGVATGDQAIFVSRNLFSAIGGYQNIPLMEDIALSKSLKQYAKPVCLKQQVLTSTRRWEHRGLIKTVVLMWVLRLSYFFGANPDDLHRLYYPED